MSTDPWFYNWQFLGENKERLKGCIIDIGCGTSKYKPFLVGMHEQNTYVGVDYYVSDKVDHVIDLNKTFPLPADTYDAAICISVLEHLREPLLCLQETFRILKPGGSLILSAPWIYPFHDVPEDFFRFSRKALEMMLQKSGFEIISIEPTGGRWHVCLVFLRYWLPVGHRLYARLERLIKRPLASEHESPRYRNCPSHHVIARKPV